MSDPIRERIIANMVSALSVIRTSNGYMTDIGRTVLRCRASCDPAELPATVVWQKPEQRPEESGRKYGGGVLLMPVQIEALHGGISAMTSEQISRLHELLIADMIEAVTGAIWTIPFEAGASAIAAGDIVTGGISGATGYIQSITVDTGSWDSADAAGSMVLRRVSGDFSAAETISTDSGGIAQTAGAAVPTSAVERVSGGLADRIDYASGGADEFPAGEAEHIGVPAVFNVYYKTAAGNPYA